MRTQPLKRYSRLLWLLLGLALLWPAPALPRPVGEKRPAPALRVHQEAPDFALRDLSGKEVRLSGFRGKKNVVLVFYRGWVGYW